MSYTIASPLPLWVVAESGAFSRVTTGNLLSEWPFKALAGLGWVRTSDVQEQAYSKLHLGSLVGSVCLLTVVAREGGRRVPGAVRRHGPAQERGDAVGPLVWLTIANARQRRHHASRSSEAAACSGRTPFGAARDHSSSVGKPRAAPERREGQ